MGLDMWLFLKDKVSDEQEEIAYWRKANAIHLWMCNWLNNGNEINCEPHEIGITELRILRDTCERVIQDISLADELLPTTSGFFFGSTEYDEWYIQDLQETVVAINRVEKRLSPTDVIIYDAWW